MKPVEIEILLKDRLTPDLVKSGDSIRQLFDTAKNALSATEGRAEKLRRTYLMLEECAMDYAHAIAEAEKAQRAYREAGDSEAYEIECQKVRELEKEVNILISTKKELSTAWSEELESLAYGDDKTEELAESTKHLSDATEDLSDSSKGYTSTLSSMLGGQQAMNAVMDNVPPGLRQIITGIDGMTSSSKAFIATPIGMALAALAVSIALLNTYWQGTIEGEREFVEISGYAQGVLKSIKDECIGLGRQLSGMFKNPLQALKEYWREVLNDFRTGFSSIGDSARSFSRILSSALKGDVEGVTAAFAEMMSSLDKGRKSIEKGMLGIVKRGSPVWQVADWIPDADKTVGRWERKASRDASIAAEMRSIEEERVSLLHREAEIERELAKLRNDMYSGSASDRIKAQARAQELVNEKYGKQIELAERASKVAHKNYYNHESNLEDKRIYEEAKAEVERLKGAQESAMLPFNRRGVAAENALANEAKKAAKEAAQEMKAQNNLAFLATKQQAQNERAARRLALQTRQAYMEGLNEGHEKVMAQLKIQREQELLAIEEQKDNALMEKISQAKQLFDADKKNQGLVFDMTSVSFSEEEQKKWDALSEAVGQKLQRLEHDALQMEAETMRQFLENYGDYQQQRLAIAEEYAEKIRRAQTEGERLSLAMQRDERLEKMGKSQLEAQMDWKGIFSELKGHTRDYLTGLRRQLENLLSSGQITDMEQLATLQAKIADINQAIQEQSRSWSDVGQRMREHKRLVQEAADARGRLESARAREREAQTGKSLTEASIRLLLPDDKKKAPLTKDLLKGIEPNTEGYGKMKDLLESLALSEAKLEKARRQVKEATEQAEQAEDAARTSTGDQIAGWFSDMQEKFERFGINEIPDLLSTLGLDGLGEKAAQGLAAFNDAAGAAKDLASGNYVGAALKGMSAISNIGGLFGIGGDADKNYAKDMERLSASNDHLRQSIDRLSERMEHSGYLAIEEDYEEQKRYLQQVAENRKEELARSLRDWKKSNIWGKGHQDSGDTVLAKNLSADDWSRIIQALGYDPRTSRSTGLDNLTPEEWARIRDGKDNGFLWDKIVQLVSKGYRDASTYLEQYVGLVDEEKELEERHLSVLTGISFSDMRENFRSELLNMESDARDTSAYVSRIMAESLVDNLLDSKYQEDLEQWREDLSKALTMEGGSGQEQALLALKGRYQQLMERARADASIIYDATGYDKTTTQSGRAGAFTAMSQEQGSKLEGLFTSGLQHWASMDEQMTDVSEQMGSACDSLRRIEANTGSSARSASDILEEIRKIIRDGLKMK